MYGTIFDTLGLPQIIEHGAVTLLVDLIID